MNEAEEMTCAHTVGLPTLRRPAATLTPCLFQYDLRHFKRPAVLLTPCWFSRNLRDTLTLDAQT
ncbi:hypothetical protein [Achromobacter animicus]|uniref:hypothetical protein n=1 Tax=Achromobacter animicus TaxID=1389935 RepID=UPI0028ACFB80|nr:hypothetical protein [Achromobacter animicus]